LLYLILRSGNFAKDADALWPILRDAALLRGSSSDNGEAVTKG
jgi:hypothetical protein